MEDLHQDPFSLPMRNLKRTFTFTKKEAKSENLIQLSMSFMERYRGSPPQQGEGPRQAPPFPGTARGISAPQPCRRD